MRRFQLPGSFPSIALFTVLMLVCAALPLWGQTGSLGTVTGVVTDPSNAVVPDATVTIKDKANSTVTTQTTNSAGRYTFLNVRPGDYEVSVTKAGFSKVTIPSDIVEVGTTSTNNITLKVGSENQTIEVQSSGVELQTLNATVGNTVSGLALDSLPTIARDTSTFLTLQAGISPDGSVAGAVVDQSSFQLDGGENTNDMDGSMSVYTTSFAGDPTGGSANQSNGVAAGATGVMPTPADSVQEFKVNVAGQGADFNSSAGAQVIIQTKSGTDQWHGTAYEYYLDNNLNANTWQNNFTGRPERELPLQPLRRRNRRTDHSEEGPGRQDLLSSPTTRASASLTPRRLSARFLPPQCGLGLLTFGGVTYNLNPTPVTFNGVTYQPAQCSTSPNGLCDPRAIGINPLVQQMWNKYMPLSNESGCGL